MSDRRTLRRSLDEDDDFHSNKDDYDDEYDDGDDGDDDEGGKHVHKTQMENARRFLWDEDEDEDGHNLGFGDGGRLATQVIRTPNITQDVDLEDHLVVGRHHHDNDIISTPGLFRRTSTSSIGSTGRMGRHVMGYGKFQRRNPLVRISSNLYYCLLGSVALCFERIRGKPNDRRNACLVFGTLLTLLVGVVIAVVVVGTGLGDEGSLGNSSITPQTGTGLATSIPVEAPHPAPRPNPEPVPRPDPEHEPEPQPGPQLDPHPEPEEKPMQEEPGASIPEVVPDSGFTSEGDLAARLTALEKKLTENSGVSPDLLKDVTSAQHKAWQWIIKVDPARLSPDDSFMLERYALAALFFSFTGLELWEDSRDVPTAHWTSQANWMTKEGYCSWYGVACRDAVREGNAKIMSINLASNGLSGHLAPELRFLSDLEILDVSDNRIGSHIPTDLATMSNLQSVVLNNNELNGSIPPGLASLIRLLSLNLGGNDLSGTLPATLAGSMTSLKTLILDDNRNLRGPLPADMSGWRGQLEVLRLERCNLSGIIPASFYELTSLMDVRLRSNQFQGSIASSLSNLTNIQYLHIIQNSFTGSLPDAFDHLQGLIELFIVDTELEGPLPRSLMGVTNIEKISLSGNRFSGSIPNEMGNLRNLHALLLHGNMLTGIIPDVFGDMSNMDVFKVQRNKFAGSIPPSLGNCTKLKKITLEENSFSNPIPSGLSNLSDLELLYIHSNDFTGSLPEDICKLRDKKLEKLTADCKSSSFECICCTACA